MLQIPLDAVPNQNIITTVNDQQCRINVRSISGNLFFSLVFEEKEICKSVLCVDRSPLVRNKASQFIGDFIFLDTQGEEKPTYDKLNSRFLLIYDNNGFDGELQ